MIPERAHSRDAAAAADPAHSREEVVPAAAEAALPGSQRRGPTQRDAAAIAIPTVAALRMLRGPEDPPQSRGDRRPERPRRACARTLGLTSKAGTCGFPATIDS